MAHLNCPELGSLRDSAAISRKGMGIGGKYGARYRDEPRAPAVLSAPQLIPVVFAAEPDAAATQPTTGPARSHGTLVVECRYCDMRAIDPPIRLDGYPNEPIDSTEAAAKFIERHDGAFDIEGTNLIDLLRGADTQTSADAACKAFRQWAECSGLLSGADSPP